MGTLLAAEQYVTHRQLWGLVMLSSLDVIAYGCCLVPLGSWTDTRRPLGETVCHTSKRSHLPSLTLFNYLMQNLALVVINMCVFILKMCATEYVSAKEIKN